MGKRSRKRMTGVGEEERVELSKKRKEEKRRKRQKLAMEKLEEFFGLLPEGVTNEET